MCEKTEKLKQDLKVVVEDLEQILEATKQSADAKVLQLRQDAANKLQALKEAHPTFFQKAQEGKAFVVKQAETGSNLVKAHPGKALGIAAGIGLAIGAWIKSRK